MTRPLRSASDQWMLLTEGATITAAVEGDRAAAHKASAGAEAILREPHRPPPNQ